MPPDLESPALGRAGNSVCLKRCSQAWKLHFINHLIRRFLEEQRLPSPQSEAHKRLLWGE